MHTVRSQNASTVRRDRAAAKTDLAIRQPTLGARQCSYGYYRWPPFQASHADTQRTALSKILGRLGFGVIGWRRYLAQGLSHILLYMMLPGPAPRDTPLLGTSTYHMYDVHPGGRHNHVGHRNARRVYMARLATLHGIMAQCLIMASQMVIMTN